MVDFEIPQGYQRTFSVPGILQVAESIAVNGSYRRGTLNACPPGSQNAEPDFATSATSFHIDAQMPAPEHIDLHGLVHRQPDVMHVKRLSLLVHRYSY